VWDVLRRFETAGLGERHSKPSDALKDGMGPRTLWPSSR
jgi:hypothetical protein